MRMFLLLVALCGGPAMAAISDTTIGNGGDVVRRPAGANDPSYYLLDLFETGMAENPYFDERLVVPADIRARAKKVLGDSGAADLVARKIAEIANRDRLLGHSLLRTLEILQWKFVSYPLKNVPDEGTVYDGELFQAAIRQGTTIFIQNGLWSQMVNDQHRAALVLHELVYALYVPEELKGGLNVQRSYRVREITSYFFDAKWEHFSAGEFYRILNAKLPTSAVSGVKMDPSDASNFKLAPMFSISGYIPTQNDLSTYAHVPLSSKTEGEIDAGRAEAFCRHFSLPLGTNHKSGSYEFGILELQVRLQRGAYHSPLGILDFIDWGGAEEARLPPYINRENYPRIDFRGEDHHVLTKEVIFDFTKFSYSPRIAEKSRQACLSFIESGMKKFGLIMDEYR